jgi:hypothetical protein
MTAPDRGRRKPLAAAAASAVALIAAVAVALASGDRGPERIRAVVFAAGTCAAGVVASTVVSLLPATTPSARVAMTLAASGLRLFPALVALGWLQAGGRDLRGAGAGGLLVAFYLVVLAVDVAGTIMEARRDGRPAGRTTAN